MGKSGKVKKRRLPSESGMPCWTKAFFNSEPRDLRVRHEHRSVHARDEAYLGLLGVEKIPAEHRICVARLIERRRRNRCSCRDIPRHRAPRKARDKQLDVSRHGGRNLSKSQIQNNIPCPSGPSNLVSSTAIIHRMIW